jgi:SNF2 family DNA or RNA helicase
MTYTGDTSKRKDKRIALMRWDVVLTTYRTLLNDIELLSQNGFGIVVFDESQAFKTATSQIHQAVTRLQALHRMALSGTPVENNLQELWSLMNVLNPNLLGNERSFLNAFVNPIAVQMEESRRDLLRRLIAPYFLKRTKEEVLSDLPERQDEVVVCAMTDEQTSQYTEELSKARNEWLDPTASSQGRQIHILAALQRLRQIANGEGKMGVVFDYLENLRQTRHKVLIFSEYVTLLEHVGNEMTSRGWNYALLTGQTQDREQVIARFQQSPDCQFFLISLKAGGVGLNLTAADYVFLLDPWWNRAAEEQAIARAHRIGQQRSVFVYRFVSAGTLEEQILTLQDRKQSLIDSVMPFICK